MRHRTNLSVCQLDLRNVPALFFWVGGNGSPTNTDALDCLNYQDGVGHQWTRLPTVGDDIAIGATARTPMEVRAGILQCDTLILSSAAPTVYWAGIVPPVAANLYVNGGATLRVLGRAGMTSDINGGSIEIREGGHFDFYSGVVNFNTYRINMIDGLYNPTANTGDIYFSHNCKVFLNPTTTSFRESAATLYNGIDSTGGQSPSSMAVSALINFHNDAGLYNGAVGDCELFAGTAPLRGANEWMGDLGWAGYGDIYNAGLMVANASMSFGMPLINVGEFQVLGGDTLTVTGWDVDGVTGRHWAINQAQGRFVQGPGSTVNLSGAWMYTTGGAYLLADESNAATFTLSGSLYVTSSGVVVMDAVANNVGTLFVTGQLQFNGGELRLNANGTTSDRISCNDISVAGGAKLDLTTTNTPPSGTRITLFSSRAGGDGFLIQNITQIGGGWVSADGPQAPWRDTVMIP